MYRLQYIRRGFANNSSSSHSIVILDAPMKDDFHSDYYDWGMFVLASKEEKAKYFTSQLHQAYGGVIGNATHVLSHSFFGVIGDTPEIDHQSCFHLPRMRDGSDSMEFLKDIGCKIINNDKLAIWGSNDNGGDEWSGKTLELPLRGYGPLVARKEKDGTWILFDQFKGHKIRLAPDLLADVTNRKADTPELVDVKITDYCEANCAFCYQNSSIKGKHASLKDIEKIAVALNKLNVFEVVLGGGEPTEHPDFEEIIKIFKDNGVIPSFTTKSIKWFSNKKLGKLIAENVGSIAISCNSVAETEMVTEALKAKEGREWHGKVDLQFIVGLTPETELYQMIDVAKKGLFDVSFVGYKKVGRASTPEEFIDEQKFLSKVGGGYGYLKVDTSLLKKCPLLVQDKTCETREGLNSLYIDAVAKTIRESSYTGESQPINLDSADLAADINYFFRKI